ncbi:MAG: hypothetical protein DI498_11745 [Paracoccus denitrificans]|nr:MAG: hypothetical protein DI498_11745 [Paracoccus denitrificans]PZO83415.1 MAG: hypothetical protein DI633_11745 [Paracoccus denitrificans]
MRKLAMTVVIGLLCTPAVGQDFNYTPGWANTHNFNQLHNRSSGKSKATGKQTGTRQGKRQQVCQLEMLSKSDQRRIEQQSRAKIAELGPDRGGKWVIGFKQGVRAAMARDGMCRLK